MPSWTPSGSPWSENVGPAAPCGRRGRREAVHPMANLEQARAAKERLRATLEGRSDVRGVGIARGGDGSQPRVTLSPRSGPDVPGHVDGVGVDVRVVGALHASA